MEAGLILLDTSVFIDYFRKTNKQNSLLFKLRKENFRFSSSIILFIAATTIANKLPSATINKKHFERIENLEIITDL